MARRFVTRTPHRRPPNRAWAGIVPAAAVTIPANTAVLLATFTLDNDGIDETVLRVVGGVQVASDQLASSESQIGAIGMCVVTDTAAALGITAIPDPVSDVGDDVWFFYQGFAQQVTVLTAVGIAGDLSTWYPFDQKAKRIIHSGQTIALVGANAHATNGMAVTVVMRILGMVRGT